MENKLFFLVKADQISLLDHQLSKMFVFNEHELDAGRLYNPTKIGYIIASYLQKNNLLNRAGVVVFDGSLALEQMVSPDDRPTDIARQVHVKIAVNQDWYYQATLRAGLLLQYQLLFAQIGIYIEIFTSEMVLHIQYLRYLAKKDLSCVDNLARLQDVVNSVESDLYTKFVQAVGKI